MCGRKGYILYIGSLLQLFPKYETFRNITVNKDTCITVKQKMLKVFLFQ